MIHLIRRRACVPRITSVISMAAAFMVFDSCQSTDSRDDSNAPQPVVAVMAYKEDLWKLPDSITWSVGASTDTQTVVRIDSAPGQITAHFVLPKATRDTIHVGLWAGGMRYIRVPFLQPAGSSTLEFTRSVVDSVARLLLIGCTDRKDRNRDTLHARYARSLAEGDSAFEGFPDNCPMGIDAEQVLRLALAHAIKKGVPIRNQSVSWLLAIDTTKAFALTADLLKVGLVDSGDVAKAFPRYPVRVVAALKVDSLEIGQTVFVQGMFAGDSGLARHEIEVRQGDEDRTALFDFSSSALHRLDGGQSSWDLQKDASLVMKNLSAPMGSYRLVVSVFDRNGRSASAEMEFKVVAAADRTPPSIKVLSPTQNTVLPTDAGPLEIKVQASDASGIDSVVIDGLRVESVGEVYTSKVNLPATGESYAIHVLAYDKAGNHADSVVRATRLPASGVLTLRLARQYPKTQKSNLLDLKDSVLHATYVAVSPNGVSDTGVSIGGVVAHRSEDSVWSVDLPVAADGIERTIPVDLVDLKGVKASDWFNVARRKDSIGPVIHRISPVLDSMVANAVQSVLVRIRVEDSSKIDSVYIDGRKSPDIAGNNYIAQVFLYPTGKPTPIHVVAWDRWGNKSDSVINVTREAPVVAGPPRFLLSEPTTRRGNSLLAELDSIRIRWVATSEFGLSDTAVRIGGVLAKRENDSVWSARVFVPGTGKEFAIPCSMLDAMNRTLLDTVWATRAIFLPKPILKVAIDTSKRDVRLQGEVYGTLASKVALRWTVQGDCAGCEFRIDGKSTLLSDGAVVLDQDVLPGRSTHSLLVTLGGEQVARDSVEIHRYGAMTVNRSGRKTDTVGTRETTATVEWTVLGAVAVGIDGRIQDPAPQGVYSKVLESLQPGLNTARLVAVDSLGDSVASVATVYKGIETDLLIVQDRADSIQWDSAVFSVTSVQSNATIQWSHDSIDWRAVPSDGKVVILQSGRVFAKASCPGYANAEKVSKPVTILHTNQAPGCLRVMGDTIVAREDSRQYRALWADPNSISVGWKWDANQTPRFRVTPVGKAALLFAEPPAIDSVTGILTFLPQPDSNGIGTFRIQMRDDGGTANGGVDSTAEASVVIKILKVNDAPIFDSLPPQVVPFGPGWTTFWKESLALPGKARDESTQVVSYRIEKINDQARNCVDSIGIQTTIGPSSKSWNQPAYFTTFSVKADRPCSGGHALFRLVAQDNGGTENGGVDTAETELDIVLNDQVEVNPANNNYPKSTMPYRKFGDRYWFLDNYGSGLIQLGDTSFTNHACPSGWRLPTRDDWTKLVDSFGINHIRSTTGWDSVYRNTKMASYNGDDAAGFHLSPTNVEIVDGMGYGSLSRAYMLLADHTFAVIDRSLFWASTIPSRTNPQMDSDGNVRCVMGP